MAEFQIELPRIHLGFVIGLPQEYAAILRRSHLGRTSEASFSHLGPSRIREPCRILQRTQREASLLIQKPRPGICVQYRYMRLHMLTKTVPRVGASPIQPSHTSHAGRNLVTGPGFVKRRQAQPRTRLDPGGSEIP